jgi:hypothetical protein
MGVRKRQTAKKVFSGQKKKLAVGHLLGHVKQKPAVAVINSA